MRAAVATHLLSICVALAGGATSPADAAGVEAELADEALLLHLEAIVIDGHSDTTPLFEDPNWNFAERHELGQMDLPRIREGGLDAQFFSIYMGAQTEPGSALRKARTRIAAFRRMLERNADRVEQASSAEDIRRIVESGKLAALLGIEGGHIIEDSLERLREFHRLGVRYMTLTHSFHTEWADSSGIDEVPEPEHGGLAPFGREIVLEMNRLGMLVDVSHVSDATFRDVLEVSRAPVIASHSSCRALANHPRNLSDGMLRALAAHGGLVMLNFYPPYIDEKAAAAALPLKARLRSEIVEIRARFPLQPAARQLAFQKLYARNPFPQTPLAVLLDHFDHAIRVAGADHVGLGADWDGVPSMPEGLEDVSRLPVLTRGLLERGHSPDVVRRVLGANLLRVMARAQALADPQP